MRQRPHVAVLAAVLAAFALGFGCVSARPVEERQVSGFVRDERTEAGVPNARVTFQSDTLDRAMAVTDGAGLYQLTVATDVPLGQVRVEATGYLSREATVYFDTPTRRLDFVLRPVAAR